MKRLQTPFALVSRDPNVKLTDGECAEFFKVALNAANSGNLLKAVGILQGLVSNRPANHEFVLTLAGIFSELGEFELAEEHLKSAAHLKPDDRLTQFHIGVLLAETERFAEAEEQFRKVLSMPDNPTDHKDRKAHTLHDLAACILANGGP